MPDVINRKRDDFNRRMWQALLRSLKYTVSQLEIAMNEE